MAVMEKLRLLEDIVLLKLGYPRLFSITINMTDKCNLRCKMCNIWTRKTKNEINADVFEGQMRESKTLKNVKLFNFAGGEPFLVKDLDKFVMSVVKHARPIQVRFVTNGFLTDVIARKMEEFLQEHKNTNFGLKISLDGTENTHDHIRGIKGSFEHVVNTIDKLNDIKKKYGNRLNINIGFTVNKINFREVDDIYKLAMEKNVGFLFKPIMRIRKFSNEYTVGDLFLNKEEAEELIEYNKRFLKEGRAGKGFMERMVYKHFYKIMNKYMKEPRNYIKCYALSGSCYIIPNGDVTSCLLLNDVFGNLNKKNFDEIWTDEKTIKRRSEILNSMCHCLTPCDTIPSLMVDKFPFY